MSEEELYELYCYWSENPWNEWWERYEDDEYYVQNEYENDYWYGYGDEPPELY